MVGTDDPPRSVAVVPFPSAPKPLLPQHFTAPPDTTAHASSPFVATAVAPLTPDTTLGVVEQENWLWHISGPEVLPSPS